MEKANERNGKGKEEEEGGGVEGKEREKKHGGQNFVRKERATFDSSGFLIPSYVSVEALKLFFFFLLPRKLSRPQASISRQVSKSLYMTLFPGQLSSFISSRSGFNMCPLLSPPRFSFFPLSFHFFLPPTLFPIQINF